MIRRIAVKEFREILRDGRFRWAAAVVLALLLIALASGRTVYHSFAAEQRRAQEETYEHWESQGRRNPHTAAHYGVYAFKPRLALSLFDPGVEAYLGTAVWLEAHYQNPVTYRPAEDASGAQRFGELTPAFVLQVLAPLLLIVMTFSAFSGERESGTLRQTLSIGIRARSLALGKLFGAGVAMLVLTLPGAIAAAGALAWTANTLDADPGWLRAGVMALAYALYLITFLCLSLAVSAWSRSSRAALVTLLAFWACGVFLVPRLASDLSERVYSVPTGPEFWTAVTADKQTGINGHDTRDERVIELKRGLMERYGVNREEDLPVNFQGFAMIAGEKFTDEIYDRHYGRLWDLYESQESLHRLSSILSPLPAMRLLSMGLAGTDISHHRAFVTAAEQYRRELNVALNEDLAYNAKAGDFFYAVGEDFWRENPRFAYTPPTARDAIQQHLANLAILALWCAGSIGLAVAAASCLRPV